MDQRDRIVRRDQRSRYTSHFALMDQVHIDDDTSLRGYVTALCWRSEEGHTLEVSWMHNGQPHSAWFQPSRLSLRSRDGSVGGAQGTEAKAIGRATVPEATS
jgi:hypothetical protein